MNIILCYALLSSTLLVLTLAEVVDHVISNNTQNSTGDNSHNYIALSKDANSVITHNNQSVNGNNSSNHIGRKKRAAEFVDHVVHKKDTATIYRDSVSAENIYESLGKHIVKRAFGTGGVKKARNVSYKREERREYVRGRWIEENVQDSDGDNNFNKIAAPENEKNVLVRKNKQTIKGKNNSNSIGRMK